MQCRMDGVKIWIVRGCSVVWMVSEFGLLRDAVSYGWCQNLDC